MNKEWCIVFARGTFFRKCCKCLFRHFHYTTSRIKVSFFYAKSRTCSFIDKTILFQKRFLLKIRLPFLVIITMHWYLVKFLPKTDDFRNQLVGTLLCSMLSIFHWNLSSLVIQCATMLIKSYIILGDIYTTKIRYPCRFFRQSCEWKRAGLLRPGSVTGRGACKRKRILQCHAHRLWNQDRTDQHRKFCGCVPHRSWGRSGCHLSFLKQKHQRNL